MIQFDRHGNRWDGTCPRCGKDSFFETKSQFVLASGLVVETLYCPGKHAIIVESIDRGDGTRTDVESFPLEYIGPVPSWLPEKYKGAYRELLEAKTKGLKRSVVSLCGLLLEAHVNELIKNPGEKKKTLFTRLEVLFQNGSIDPDQFSSGTITRITRNEVLHPEDILNEITDEEMEETFGEITNFFERAYKYRSSRALPSGSNTITEQSDQSSSS